MQERWWWVCKGGIRVKKGCFFSFYFLITRFHVPFLFGVFIFQLSFCDMYLLFFNLLVRLEARLLRLGLNSPPDKSLLLLV